MEDDDVIPKLMCKVEIDLEGPNIATLNKWAADALRRLADSIEKDDMGSGFHPVAHFADGEQRFQAIVSSCFARS